MIDNYRRLKRIALTDQKYYLFPQIQSIEEKDDSIEIETDREYIIIPKSAITRIEYYKEGAAYERGR